MDWRLHDKSAGQGALCPKNAMRRKPSCRCLKNRGNFPTFEAPPLYNGGFSPAQERAFCQTFRPAAVIISTGRRIPNLAENPVLLGAESSVSFMLSPEFAADPFSVSGSSGLVRLGTSGAGLDRTELMCRHRPLPLSSASTAGHLSSKRPRSCPFEVREQARQADMISR